MLLTKRRLRRKMQRDGLLVRKVWLVRGKHARRIFKLYHPHGNINKVKTSTGGTAFRCVVWVRVGVNT